MADHTAPERAQDAVPPQPPRKRTFTDVFRAILSELKHALDDELLGVKTNPALPAPPVGGTSDGTVSVEEIMEASDQVDEGLQHLQGHHAALGHHIDTMLRLEPEAQRQLVQVMWQTVAKMEAALTTVQDAHVRLQRTLRDKRVVLTSTKQELQQYIDRDGAQRETIATLRQEQGRLRREQSALQHQLALQQEHLAREQQQHSALTQQFDELVGAHHQLRQLLQRYLREQQTT